MAELSMPMRRYVCCFLSLFGLALFRACDLLVVQPDAWERCAGCATLCSSSFARVEQAAKAAKGAAPGAAVVYTLRQEHQAKPSYRFISCRSLKLRGDLFGSLRAQEPESSFSNRAPAAPHPCRRNHVKDVLPVLRRRRAARRPRPAALAHRRLTSANRKSVSKGAEAGCSSAEGPAAGLVNLPRKQPIRANLSSES